MDAVLPTHYSEDEFLELVRQQMPSVRHWLCQYLQNKQDRDDVLQNTVIAAWIGREHFTPDAPILAWLQRIAKRQLCNWVRSEQRKGKRHPLRMEFTEEWHSSAERNGEFLEIVNGDISTLLSILPRDVQDLILSIYIEGYSYTEIAVKQGCTTSSLKMKVKRGMEKMRKFAREGRNMPK